MSIPRAIQPRALSGRLLTAGRSYIQPSAAAPGQSQKVRVHIGHRVPQWEGDPGVLRALCRTQPAKGWRTLDTTWLGLTDETRLCPRCVKAEPENEKGP